MGHSPRTVFRPPAVECCQPAAASVAARHGGEGKAGGRRLQPRLSTAGERRSMGSAKPGTAAQPPQPGGHVLRGAGVQAAWNATAARLQRRVLAARQCRQLFVGLQVAQGGSVPYEREAMRCRKRRKWVGQRKGMRSCSAVRAARQPAPCARCGEGWLRRKRLWRLAVPRCSGRPGTRERQREGEGEMANRRRSAAPRQDSML